jgi:predicted ATPase/class 3 adenylate cyclase
MRCTKCGTDNAADSRFCNQCAEPLGLACPKCAWLNAPDAKFCAQCAAVLGSPAAKPEPLGPSLTLQESADAAAMDGERKTVTALFADIKGSTEMMEDLDPEEARAVIDPALKLMMDAVHRYDGHVVQSTGDGIFALFGAPVAHEDHPQRALYAALRMQEEIRRYAERLRVDSRRPIQIRVGVNTGEVVVRSIATGDGRVEYTPIGHTTNLASRMQALADPGATVVSESTRKLVEGYFAMKPLGPARIKGITEPVSVYEVTGLGPLRTRLQRSANRGYTKFVGREREIEAMKRAAELAKNGHGQIVAAVAEPGIGKSRLFFEFKETVSSEWMLLEALPVSHGNASAYLPVIDLLHSYFEISSEDDIRKRREKVASKVAILDRVLEDALPYFYGLLGIVEVPDPLAQMAPQIRKRRTLEAIKRLLLRESLNQPLIVIFEDLHLIDEETQALLNLLADSIGTAKILLVVNYRPEYSHQWGSKTFYTQLRLDPLGKDSVEEMLAELLGGDAALAALRQLIIERTEGNPFFMEEAVQVLLDDGTLVRNGTIKLTKPLGVLKIPPTVQAILASRIDRLPNPEKELLQTLSVIGKEFPINLVTRVASMPEPELTGMLGALQQAEFIYEQPAITDVEYTFKHALTQEVAYNSVLIEKRKPTHERIAAAIEALATSRIEDRIAELAHHYSRSNNPMKAAFYLQWAGMQAEQRSAYPEAMELARRGISILASAAQGSERDRQELGLQSILGSMLATAFSPGSVEVERVVTRCIELCRQIGDENMLFAAVVNEPVRLMVMAEGQRAREVSEQALATAERVHQPWMLGMAHAMQAASLLWFGQPEAALAHCEKSLAALGPGDQAQSHLPHFTTIFPTLKHSLWLLGFPERARRAADETISKARALKNTLAVMLSLTSWDLNRFLRDLVRTRDHAEAAIALGSEYGIRPLELLAIGQRAWGLVQENPGNANLAEVRDLLEGRWVEGCEKMGIGSPPSVFAMLVEARLKMKQPVAGLRVLEQAFSCVEPTGERMYESELYRLKGELLALDGTANNAQVEESFRTAIDIAREQKARSWELRATTSLARLLAKQGKRDEARAMLAEIYNWFTEGFDTADLKDAKALLTELGS